MDKPHRQGTIHIRRYDGVKECDVIVTLRDRELVVAVPDYERALRWAQMEAKAYKIATNFSEALSSTGRLSSRASTPATGSGFFPLRALSVAASHDARSAES